MGEQLDEPTDDAHLRRIASGKTLPTRDKTYMLGEGLLAAGLPWCSGVLALLAHPFYVSDAYGVLDIASRDGASVHEDVDDWFFIARAFRDAVVRAAVPDRPPVVHIKLLEQLVIKSTLLRGCFIRAWAAYLRNGVGEAHGLFGALYFNATDPRLKRTSGEVCAMIADRQAAKGGEIRGELMRLRDIVNAELSLLNALKKDET